MRTTSDLRLPFEPLPEPSDTVIRDGRSYRQLVVNPDAELMRYFTLPLLPVTG